MSERTGQQIGNYRLVKLLGRGGFADVYQGEHIFLPTYAAIKILHSTILHEEQLKQFQTEARAIAQLEHPHIVRILDFGVEANTPYLVMEYAEQGSLRRLYPRGTRVPLETIVSYVNQIAKALQYAHDKRIIHRDVKPDNFLLRKDSSLALADFGILKEAHSTLTQAQSEAYAGTLAYSAPEQLRGYPRTLSDEYALGIVVYELLCGEVPFKGSTFTQVALQHIQDPVPPLLNKMVIHNPAVEAVVMKALAKDWKDRFESVTAFARALEKASLTPPVHPAEEIHVPVFPLDPTLPVQPVQVQEQPVAKEQPHTTGNTQTWQRTIGTEPVSQTREVIEPTQLKETVLPQTHSEIPATEQVSRRGFRPTRRQFVITGLALGGLTCLGLGYEGWQYLTTPHPITTYNNGFIVFSVAWSPDSKYIASGGDAVQVWEATSGNKVLTYTGHSSSPVHSVAWSPDGKYIASGGDDKTVQVWEAPSGNTVLTYTGHSNLVNSAAWSPDGKYIASGSLDNTVQVWEATSGNKLVTYTGHSGLVASVAWSPDGKYIASGSWDKTVQVWEAASGNKVTTYTGFSYSVTSVAWSPDGKYIASGSSDNPVQVWEVANGITVTNYTGHNNSVNSVAWSPDGKYIASGSDDKTVQVWEAASGNKVTTYTSYSVTSVAWSPDGKHIASGSDDKTVKVWQAPS